MKLIALPLIVMFFYSGNGTAWDLQPTDESSSVKVWTKAVKNSKFKAFKGQVQINAPLDRVLHVIRDTEQIPSWYYRTQKAVKLKKINDSQSLSYSVTSAPWPVSNRDSVTLSTKRALPNGDYLIELMAQPDAYPKQPGLVRIPKLDGFWKLHVISTNITEVTFQIAAEPGGDIPSWLANSMVIDMPFYTLSNLKAKLEKR